jgi:hypothetical protein
MADLLGQLSITNNTTTQNNPPPKGTVPGSVIIGGRNNTIAPPPPTSITPANFISNTDISRPHRKFLDVLSEYAASVPLKSFFYVTFNIPNLISEQNLKNLSEFFVDNDSAKTILSRPQFSSQMGCIFCREVTYPGEALNGTTLELDNRGFRSSPYAGGRSNAFLSGLRLTFYESSISFIDHIIRPWVLLTSYYSTITRPPTADNEGIAGLRQDITCVLMTRTGVAQSSDQILFNTSSQGDGTYPENRNNPWGPRKIIVFKNCFPKDFSNLSSAHSDSNSLETATVSFNYSHYEIMYKEVGLSNSTITLPPPPGAPTATQQTGVIIGG